MIITVNWLREYVDFGITPEELADKLTMAGLEVEGVEHRGKGLENVVVAQIVSMKPHPDATKLPLRRLGRRKELPYRVRRKQHEIRRQGRARENRHNPASGTEIPGGYDH
jgi:hypothetical protein